MIISKGAIATAMRIALSKLRSSWFRPTLAVINVWVSICAVALIGLFTLPRDSLMGDWLLDQALKAHNILIVNPPWKGPNIEWAGASAESVGLDQDKLDLMTRTLAARGTKAFLLIKENRIIEEWYGPALGPNSRFSVASLPKALVAGPALAATLDAGAIQLDEPASEYIPRWASDSLRSRIRIVHLATHSAGVEDVYFGGGVRPDVGWQGTYYQNPGQRFEIALTDAPIQFAPGTEHRYSGVGYYVLAYALGTALQEKGLPDLRSLLRNRVMQPLGIPDSDWEISYGQPNTVNGMQLYAIGSGANYTARAAARVGQLMLARGSWQGTQLLSSESVRLLITHHDTPGPDRSSGEPVPVSGLGWWINTDGVWSSVPPDAYVGVGADHQILLVIPSLELVVVRFGDALGGTHWGEGFWSELEQFFLEPLMEAISARA